MTNDEIRMTKECRMTNLGGMLVYSQACRRRTRSGHAHEYMGMAPGGAELVGSASCGLLLGFGLLRLGGGVDEGELLAGAEGVAEEVFFAVLFDQDADLAGADDVEAARLILVKAGFYDDVGVDQDGQEHVIDEVDLGEEGDQEHAEDGGAKGGQQGPEQPVVFGFLDSAVARHSDQEQVPTKP